MGGASLERNLGASSDKALLPDEMFGGMTDALPMSQQLVFDPVTGLWVLGGLVTGYLLNKALNIDWSGSGGSGVTPHIYTVAEVEAFVQAWDPALAGLILASGIIPIIQAAALKAIDPASKLNKPQTDLHHIVPRTHAAAVLASL